MSSGPDEQRRIARAWLDTPKGDAFLLAQGQWLTALEREQQANSTEARKAAQDAALKARAALDATLGVTAFLRRRMLAASRGEPPGTAADERDFGKLTRAKTRNTRAGRAALRHAAGRYLLDSDATLTPDFALWLTGQARHANDGFDGVLSHEPTAGVDPAGATARSLREVIIQLAGYTIEQKFPDGGVIPSSFWSLAAKAHNERVPPLRAKGLKVKTVEPLTVKDWCLREGVGREQFEMARAEGRKDRAAGRMDRNRMLP